MATEKNKHDSDVYLFENQKIVDINMEKEVKKSFIEYSMSVIMSRALPDVRDGMKPGQRRVIYAMYEDHLTHDKPFFKSATTVGNVLGRYHPHGDSSVYGTMVRMAQPFSLRYPLVEGHGNFGSVDGDPPAAYRYTEARLDKIADEMTRDLEKEVVEFIPNFDNRRREPSVLPSRFPNFLVNGSVGIAVGMATNVPPHNLGEVIDGTIYRMENPDCSIMDLMEFIKGPDFPTYATIHGTSGIIDAYTTGKGRIYVRAKAEVEEDKNRIVITEIPYMVNKSLLVESIAGLVKDKRIDGITDLRDESGRDGMRIVVEYRRDANGEVILNQLYKYTQLQDTCSANFLAVVGQEPKVLNLAQILDYYIEHQKSVIRRRTEFDLEKAKARAHIFEGYKIALDNIDEIVQIMKTSESITASKLTLMDRFGLTDIQAQAIVEMTLGRLTGMERQKIEDELARLHALIEELEGVLADERKIIEIIKEEMLEIKRKYGDERRTKIEQAIDDIELEDLIEKHNCVITMTQAGYIKRLPSDTYSAQHRGGKGITAMTTREEDFIERIEAVFSHSNLLFFTNTGRVQSLRAFQIPEASRTAKGSNIVNILNLTADEKVTAMISVNEFSDNEYLTMVTKQGVIKKTLLSEYEYQRKGGKIAINLDEGDELLFVTKTNGENELLLATKEGNAVRFDESQVRPMGRSARGVRGIKLKGDDFVVGVVNVDENKKLLTITENGYGKRTDFEDFRLMKNRGGGGVICHNLTDKTGLLAGIISVDDNDDIMMITDSGIIIRTPSSDVSTYSRTASGVIVMRLEKGQRIVNVTKTAKEEEKEEEISETEENGNGAEETVIESIEVVTETEDNTAEETDSEE
ncbi:MAG: DNA gyrase subunit A [Ruminococcaceae bacterium]|nr:DNA gyrase subunit A [Oscillospiraceae bacterium]